MVSVLDRPAVDRCPLCDDSAVWVLGITILHCDLESRARDMLVVELLQTVGRRARSGSALFAAQGPQVTGGQGQAYAQNPRDISTESSSSIMSPVGLLACQKATKRVCPPVLPVATSYTE